MVYIIYDTCVCVWVDIIFDEPKIIGKVGKIIEIVFVDLENLTSQPYDMFHSKYQQMIICPKGTNGRFVMMPPCYVSPYVSLFHVLCSNCAICALKTLASQPHLSDGDEDEAQPQSRLRVQDYLCGFRSSRRVSRNVDCHDILALFHTLFSF